MKIIKKISEMIESELNSAECYAKKALKFKTEDKELADKLYELSLEKMKHMQILHGQVTRIITAYQKEKGDPPVAMQAVYDYLHERYIEKAREIKNYQALYKELS